MYTVTVWNGSRGVKTGYIDADKALKKVMDNLFNVLDVSEYKKAADAGTPTAREKYHLTSITDKK